MTCLWNDAIFIDQEETLNNTTAGCTIEQDTFQAGIIKVKCFR